MMFSLPGIKMQFHRELGFPASPCRTVSGQVGGWERCKAYMQEWGWMGGAGSSLVSAAAHDN